MPVSVVVGGQFGSEGKGKVAWAVAQRDGAAAAVRIGGPNSGHTAPLATGGHEVLRQLPTAALLSDVLCVLGPGCYIDVPVLLDEIERVGLEKGRVRIDHRAMVITSDDRNSELASDIRDRIGSTGSGTGAAVTRRAGRRPETELSLAEASSYLRPFVCDTAKLLRGMLSGGDRIVVEGTQGFGLSVMHSPYYPFTTSRDTSAAGAISEAGLSPRDVDHVILVLRAFPIRVAGNSGPLPKEIDWEIVRREGGHEADVAEYTTVTQKLRRVARFDEEIVIRAIAVNAPDEIVMNHVDHVDADCDPDGYLTQKARGFLNDVATSIDHKIDYIGLSPNTILQFDSMNANASVGQAPTAA